MNISKPQTYKLYHKKAGVPYLNNNLYLFGKLKVYLKLLFEDFVSEILVCSSI